MSFEAVEGLDDRQALMTLERIGDSDYPAVLNDDGEVVAVILQGSKKAVKQVAKVLEKDHAKRVIRVKPADPQNPLFKQGQLVAFRRKHSPESTPLRVSPVLSSQWMTGYLAKPLGGADGDNIFQHVDSHIYELQDEQFVEKYAECEIKAATPLEIQAYEDFRAYLDSLQIGERVKVTDELGGVTGQITALGTTSWNAGNVSVVYDKPRDLGDGRISRGFKDWKLWDAISPERV